MFNNKKQKCLKHNSFFYIFDNIKSKVEAITKLAVSLFEAYHFPFQTKKSFRP